MITISTTTVGTPAASPTVRLSDETVGGDEAGGRGAGGGNAEEGGGNAEEGGGSAGKRNKRGLKVVDRSAQQQSDSPH